ncbi:mannitol dehydrogenase family protein [Salimicrobium salexigens]|uniref:Mannitol-1-phosphate 5-dehydrogenase n=1 Tax=Salimicrobium salexigens TaxID=908941 RepID=A0ABY1KRL1_9BACI|nr:hypothetical protein [Salimicrobium salexigens]SIS69353.1 mannitol-1-phosphate 5-dehydrogenase [Salimicrobium salexigens]
MQEWDPALWELRYIEKIIERFNNPDLSDFVARVGRGPIRKLGPDDRLVKPARTYIQTMHEDPVNLIETIMSALTYENSEDQEAVRLKELRTRMGILGAFKEITGLDDRDELVEAIAKKLD